MYTLLYVSYFLASNKQTQLQTGLSNHTIIDAFACLREICGRYLQENSIQLGGPGTIVQVDESQFSHKPKHHRCGEIVLIEITMLLIILLGISIYSTNFELFSAVSVWGGDCSLGQLGGGGGEILHLIQRKYYPNSLLIS